MMGQLSNRKCSSRLNSHKVHLKPPGTERQSQQQQLNMRGFHNIETLWGCEDQWQNWSRKIKTAVSGMNGDLSQVLNAAETGGVRNAKEILKDDGFVDAKKEKCMKDSKEMYSVLLRRDRTGWSRSLGKTPRKLQQKKIGNNIQSAT